MIGECQHSLGVLDAILVVHEMRNTVDHPHDIYNMCKVNGEKMEVLPPKGILAVNLRPACGDSGYKAF